MQNAKECRSRDMWEISLLFQKMISKFNNRINPITELASIDIAFCYPSPWLPLMSLFKDLANFIFALQILTFESDVICSGTEIKTVFRTKVALMNNVAIRSKPTNDLTTKKNTLQPSKITIKPQAVIVLLARLVFTVFSVSPICRRVLTHSSYSCSVFFYCPRLFS